jgi:hypothetical protein
MLLAGVIMMKILFKYFILNTKLIMNQVFKIKQTENGLEKVIQKTDDSLIHQKMITLKEYQEL